MFKGNKMLMVRSPLRITLGGGGTDLPSYATRCGGFCISAAINKYVYVGINRPYNEEIILKYSQYF
jgi:D-glycero-alpha-D-manno-heptose-7-phosphate kinase